MDDLDEFIAEIGELYKSREFCQSVRCSVQLRLNAQAEGSRDYENIKEICKTKCHYTAYAFHDWLQNEGYIIIKAKEGRR